MGPTINPDGPASRRIAGDDSTRALDPCTTTPNGNVGGTGVDSGTLPRTGSDNLGLVALGLALLASGGSVVYAVHRAQQRTAA